jgi:transposase
MKTIKTLLCGCDDHEKKLVTQTAVGLEKPELKKWDNTTAGRAEMIRYLTDIARRKQARQNIFAYEASGAGFGLHDDLWEHGIICHVLAPTKMKKSSEDRKKKTDAKDALRILEALRSSYLAGNELPEIWVPDPQMRDDREVVRTRVDMGKRISKEKTRILSLLRKYSVRPPDRVGKRWSSKFYEWLRCLAAGEAPGLSPGARVSLTSKILQLHFLKEQEKHLDKAVKTLSETERYRESAEVLMSLEGVGILTAMIFLVELGDPKRFRNRRKVAAYFGLAPTSFESGEASDRKGRICRGGASRARRVICQAVWYQIGHTQSVKKEFKRMVKRNPKKKKKAVVALMRKLTIRMWHMVCEVQEEQAA